MNNSKLNTFLRLFFLKVIDLNSQLGFKLFSTEVRNSIKNVVHSASVHTGCLLEPDKISYY